MAQLVSKAYSDALFEVAVEDNLVDRFHDEIELIGDTFEAYPEFFELYKSPRIGIDERKSVVQDIFEEKISQEMMNFMKVLLDKKRASEILNIKHEFLNRVYEHKGIVKAIVESAIPMEEVEVVKLQERLSGVTGKEVILKNKVNPEILGGLVVQVGDKVIDGSVKNKLNNMMDDLTQIII